jgi:hypothetical protein
MNNTTTLPLVGAAVAAPALLPTIAVIAPPLLLGVGIAAALSALLRDDKAAKTAPATPGNTPPAPQPKRVGAGWFLFDDEPAAPSPAPNPAPKQERGFWDSFWNENWLWEDTAKPAAAAQGEAERQQRIRDNEAELARINLERREHEANIRRIEAELKAERQRRKQIKAASVVAPVATAMARPPAATPATAIAAARPQPATPPAPISAPKPAAPAPPHSPAVVMATPAPVPVNPSKFQLFAPKVTHEDLAAIFEKGAMRLARQSAVKLLLARGIKKTTAYNALRDGGRFADVLTTGEDGLLAFRS